MKRIDLNNPNQCPICGDGGGNYDPENDDSFSSTCLPDRRQKPPSVFPNLAAEADFTKEDYT